MTLAYLAERMEEKDWTMFLAKINAPPPTESALAMEMAAEVEATQFMAFYGAVTGKGGVGHG